MHHASPVPNCSAFIRRLKPFHFRGHRKPYKIPSVVADELWLRPRTQLARKFHQPAQTTGEKSWIQSHVVRYWQLALSVVS